MRRHILRWPTHTSCLALFISSPTGTPFQSQDGRDDGAQIDESLPEAHFDLAQVQSRLDWDWAGAERGFKRALELDPNSADAHD